MSFSGGSAGLEERKGLGMATAVSLRGLSAWAGLPIELRDALLRQEIHTTSDFCELFDGTTEAALELSQELVPGASFGA